MEYLLNHSDICSLIYSGYHLEAVSAFNALYDKQLKIICMAHFKVFLISLNQSIYNYILFRENVSLHKCCLDNYQKINLCCSTEKAYELGIEILTSYSFCQEYLIEKYDNPHIKEALLYIHKHLTHSIQLEDVASAINLSPPYLCTLFKSHTGSNLTDYIHKRRIALAKKLLQEPSLSLEEVSIRCGYNSYSYFCRQFKKYMSCSPNAYQKNMQTKSI